MSVTICEIENAVRVPISRKGGGLPKFLRRTRKSLGYSYLEACSLIGCAYSYISALERGRNEPSLRMAGKIAAAYGIELSALFDVMGDGKP